MSAVRLTPKMKAALKRLYESDNHSGFVAYSTTIALISVDSFICPAMRNK